MCPLTVVPQQKTRGPFHKAGLVTAEVGESLIYLFSQGEGTWTRERGAASRPEGANLILLEGYIVFYLK